MHVKIGDYYIFPYFRKKKLKIFPWRHFFFGLGPTSNKLIFCLGVVTTLPFPIAEEVGIILTSLSSFFVWGMTCLIGERERYVFGKRDCGRSDKCA